MDGPAIVLAGKLTGTLKLMIGALGYAKGIPAQCGPMPMPGHMPMPMAGPMLGLMPMPPSKETGAY